MTALQDLEVWGHIKGRGRYFMGFVQKRPKSTSLVLGLLLALTQPPVNFTWVLWLTFPVFFLLQQGLTFKNKLLCAGFFGLGYFVAGLYWIAVAFHVDFAKFWWLTPFTVLGLPALLSFLYVTGAQFAYEGVRRFFKLKESYVLFALMWSLFEGLRGYLFTGFPWNLIGYTWVWSQEMLQFNAVLGIYGVSFLTVLFAGVPLLFLSRAKTKTLLLMASVFFLVAIIWGWGHQRLRYENSFVPGVGLRLVQPCIPQTLKWEPSQRRVIFEEMAALTRLPSGQEMTHVLWPESALPFFAQDNPRVCQMLGALVPDEKGALILGVPRQEWKDNQRTLWNGLMALNSQGQVVATYNKHHLVPFGEYVPGRWLLPSTVKKVTSGGIDYTPGSGPRTLRIGNLPAFSPLICYEVIFPQGIVDAQDRPSWLLNLTNDGWYGRTSGPYQHFVMARVRAVEEGLPLVRVANNGISGVIDPLGRVLSHLDLDQKGVLDASLPHAFKELTPYAKWGNMPYCLLLLITFVGFLCLQRRARLSCSKR